jgi:hypothetical protein
VLVGRLAIEGRSRTNSSDTFSLCLFPCDKVVVWENGGTNGTTSTASFLQNMARTMPPMMQVLKEIGGVELAESLIKFSDVETATPSRNGEPAVSGAKSD